ncbi:hypothetical protein SLAGATHOR_87 [Mycobacterium phage Slagathor]|nr:hypothetical protein SLAGATHOR_87 [Mycobacterium phage Slagathor]
MRSPGPQHTLKSSSEPLHVATTMLARAGRFAQPISPR